MIRLFMGFVIFDYDELVNLNLFNEKLAKNIVDNRFYDNVDELKNSILQGFSTHFKERVLSIMENPIKKSDISEYIDRYPSNIRILGYKNEECLESFKQKVNNENISLFA